MFYGMDMGLTILYGIFFTFNLNGEIFHRIFILLVLENTFMHLI